MSFINCQQIVKAYTVYDHEIVALRGIDFEMERGEMVAIIGPSGAGKSSLLNLLGGLDTPTAGQLFVGGRNLLELKGKQLSEYRQKQVGFIWQAIERNLVGHRTALRNVTLPMELAGTGLRQRRKQAQELLAAVGLANDTYKRLTQLSGGQQQRVAIAVALANQPDLLLADEPTGALDRKTAIQVMELILRLRDEYHLTVLMVTHDMEVASYADRILTLRDGALGQDLSDDGVYNPTLDVEGRIQLPETAQSYLASADRIAVEVRPEGVLLRPEADDDSFDGGTDGLVSEDTPPPKQRGIFGRVTRRLRRNKAS